MLFCLALFLFAAASVPQPLSAALADCTAGTAKRVTIEAIQADYPAWRGKCVRVHGIAVGAHLYSDRMALLEPRIMYGEGLKRSLFLYFSDLRAPWSRPV